MSKLVINKGQRFNMLVILEECERFIQPSGQKQRGFLCLCDCGKQCKVRLSHLTNNRVRSCGCLLGDKHNQRNTKLYNTWRAMKGRCYYKNNNRYHRYGGRGIIVCDEWKNSFSKFMDWALSIGYSMENSNRLNLQIDRIDNDKNYEPSNCRFVTNIVNCNNRQVTYFVEYKNVKIPLALLLREKNLFTHYAAIRGRLERGWSVERAIDTPIKKGNYK